MTMKGTVVFLYSYLNFLLAYHWCLILKNDVLLIFRFLCTIFFEVFITCLCIFVIKKIRLNENQGTTQVLYLGPNF